jgi:hypothetical protein
MAQPEPPREEVEDNARRGLRILAWIRRVWVLICLGATSYTFWTIVDHRLDPDSGVAFWVGVSGASWILFVLISLRYLRYPAGRRPPRARKIPFRQKSYERWQRALTIDQRVLLARLLGRPAGVTRRITEIIEPTSEALSILRIITIDVEPAGRVLIPVHEQKRGQLVDGLRIHTANGERLSTLTQRETMHVLAVLIDELIDSLKAQKGISPDRESRLKLRLRRRTRKVLQSTNAATAGRIVNEITDAGGMLRNELGRNQKLAGFLSAILHRVGEFYPLLVVASVPKVRSARLGGGQAAAETRALQREPLRIEVKRTEELERPPSRWRLVNLIYTLLNVAPPRLTFPLRQADFARSYHLQVVAPHGMYFYDLDVAPLYLGEPVPVNGLTGHNRSGHELRKGGHLYLRDAKNFTSFRAEISFKEGKPGSISLAFLWTAILSLLGISSLVAESSDGIVAALLPVLFVGVTTGSIWQGVVQLKSIFGGRLSTRLSSLLNVALCMAAMVLSSIDLAPREESTEAGTNVAWGIVLVASFTNTVTMFVYWLVDSLTEQWLSRREGT